jgi:hypothetical protein
MIINEIDTSMQKLRGFSKEHAVMGAALMKEAGGNLYPMDLLAIAVLNRSVGLLEGFCDLTEKRNFVSAAPLLRIQLDNLLRFHGAWLIDDPHDFALSIFKGEKVRDMEDKSGKRMTDSYLNDKITKAHPQLKDIYEHTSGYIHLSYKHFYNAGSAGAEEFDLNLKISPVDSYVPDEIYVEALEAFLEVTVTLFRYLEGWRVIKEKHYLEGAVQEN